MRERKKIECYLGTEKVTGYGGPERIPGLVSVWQR